MLREGYWRLVLYCAYVICIGMALVRKSFQAELLNVWRETTCRALFPAPGSSRKRLCPLLLPKPALGWKPTLDRWMLDWGWQGGAPRRALGCQGTSNGKDMSLDGHMQGGVPDDRTMGAAGTLPRGLFELAGMASPRKGMGFQEGIRRGERAGG